MCTLSEVVLDIFLPNRQYQCHPYIISSTLYILYYVQLSFCTFSTQMHIVHVICMLSTHVHIICLSSLTLLVYPIIHNLVSVHCLHTHILLMWWVYYLQMYMLYTSHLHYSCQVSRTTTDNVHLICICPDSMQMTCTYTDNSSRDDMYIHICISKQYTDDIYNMHVWRQYVRKLSCG